MESDGNGNPGGNPNGDANLNNGKAEGDPCRELLAAEAIGSLLRELLSEGLPVCVQVTGGSMSPFLRTGDLITVAPRRQAGIRFGDVVAALSVSRLVVHRVVTRRSSGYITQGDARRRPDVPVADEDVLGRITKVERRGRRVWLAIGPERIIIALLSRSGLLLPLLWPLRRLARLLGLRSHAG